MESSSGIMCPFTTPMSKVSIVIPAYNEASTLREIVSRVQAVDIAPHEKEIIVVDNNSTDDTFAIASSIAGIRVIQESRPGKGAAVRAGFKASSGDILLIQDADLEYDPLDYPALIHPLAVGDADALVGIRKPTKTTGHLWSFLYYLGNTAITLATNVLYGGTASEYTGGYKVFTKQAVAGITVRTHDFAYEHELVCKVLKKKLRLVHIPIRYYPRDYSEGKKINWKDGFRILGAVIKYRFVD